VSGDDQGGLEGEDLTAGGAQGLVVVGGGIFGGAVDAPPGVGEDDGAFGGFRDGGGVLGGCGRVFRSGGSRGRAGIRRRPVVPEVVVVGGPYVVGARVGEEGGVEGVVGAVVAEDHVGYLPGADSGGGERVQDEFAVLDHAGVDDDDRVAVSQETDGRGDVPRLLVAVAVRIACVEAVLAGGQQGECGTHER
jgi:hypothetical protein